MTESPLTDACALIMDHSFGAHDPSEIRCGLDRFRALLASILDHYDDRWRVPVRDLRGQFKLINTSVVYDENLMCDEMEVTPTRFEWSPQPEPLGGYLWRAK